MDFSENVKFSSVIFPPKFFYFATESNWKLSSYGLDVLSEEKTYIVQVLEKLS